jgi:hypothetical protein
MPECLEKTVNYISIGIGIQHQVSPVPLVGDLSGIAQRN